MGEKSYKEQTLKRRPMYAYTVSCRSPGFREKVVYEVVGRRLPWKPATRCNSHLLPPGNWELAAQSASKPLLVAAVEEAEISATWISSGSNLAC